MIERAAIYSRVSTARQNAEDKVSIEDQEERCRAVCESKGWRIVRVYDEGDASGGTAQRGEFQRMLADARDGHFDVIVVREVSRLSRVAQARRAIEELMIEWGLAVCNARTGMVYSEGEGLGASLIWTVEAKMAEAELAERSFRTRMGMQGKAERGEPPGAKAPYGYRWTGRPDSKLIVDEASADVVRRLFDQIAAGATCAAVADELNAARIPSPGRSPNGWHAQTIYKLATRRAYIGEGEYGRVHWRRLNSEKERRAWAEQYFQRRGVWPEAIPAKIAEEGEKVWTVRTPPIVDPDVFARVNRHLSRTRKRHKAPRRKVRMLSGILRCEECGQAMKPTWTRKANGSEYDFYRCNPARKTSSQRCRVTDRTQGLSTYVSAERVEALVWRLIDDMLSDPTTLAAAVGEAQSAEEELAPVLTERLQRHEARLVKAERAWDAARRLYYAGEVSDHAYQRDKAHYEGEILMLRDELERMRAAAAERRRQDAALAEVEAISERWAEIRAALTDDERRILVQTLITDATITRDDQLTVTGTLTGVAGSREEVVGSA